MKVKIKPHSTLQKLFPQAVLEADLFHYQDLLEYLNSLFPQYKHYTKQLASEGFPELVLFLDKDLNPISNQDFLVKKFKEGDEVYLVPGIGGSKFLKKAFKVIVGIGLVIAAPFVAPAVLGTLGIAATATAVAITTSVITAIGVSLAVAGAVELMMPTTPTPGDAGTQAESAMFASLTNQAASGITIPLNYGQVRVAGQLLSGYTTPIPHGPNEVIRIEDYLEIPTAEQASTYNWFLPEVS